MGDGTDAMVLASASGDGRPGEGSQITVQITSAHPPRDRGVATTSSISFTPVPWYVAQAAVACDRPISVRSASSASSAFIAAMKSVFTTELIMPMNAKS